MKKFLRIVLESSEQGKLVAHEYESENYLNREFPLTKVLWTSAPMTSEQLVVELRSRGWHSTDVGDALDEARRWFGK